MSKQRNRRQHRHSPRGPASPASAAPSFTPVPVRARHDGWTPARQVTFLHALAETANVEEACRAVGMSARSAYLLKARPDAASFRQAWDLTLDFAIGRIGDALLGRALNGEVIPIFFQGEQVGERRRHDNRLAMWLLSRRQPERYGAWKDRMVATREHPDAYAVMMREAIGRVAAEGEADIAGRPRPNWPPLRTISFPDDPAEIEAAEERRQRADDARREAEWQTYADTVHEQSEHLRGEPMSAANSPAINVEPAVSLHGEDVRTGHADVGREGENETYASRTSGTSDPDGFGSAGRYGGRRERSPPSCRPM